MVLTLMSEERKVTMREHPSLRSKKNLILAWPPAQRPTARADDPARSADGQRSRQLRRSEGAGPIGNEGPVRIFRQPEGE